MDLLDRNDLIYSYSWTAIKGDDPRLTGHPDSTLLNRHEGYEVLPFINRFAKSNDFKSKKFGLKVEWLIREHLPPNVRSHANVRNWLIHNLKTFDTEWEKKIARGDIP